MSAVSRTFYSIANKPISEGLIFFFLHHQSLRLSQVHVRTGSSRGLEIAAGLDFVAGLKNILGEDEYPC